MKRIIAIAAALLCLAAQGAFGQGFMDKLRFSVETLPDPDGGGFRGAVGYKHSKRLASMLYLKQTVTAETDELDIEDGTTYTIGDTLNLARSSVAEFFIVPVEFSFSSIGEEGISLGLGAYVSKTGSVNVGYFDRVTAGVTSTSSYRFESDAIFYGPMASVEAAFDLGLVSFAPRLVFVPFFAFSEQQSQSMTMLRLWGEGKADYDSSGLPYLALSVDRIAVPVGKYIGLGGLRLGGSLCFEYSKQDIKLLSPSGTAYEWVTTDATASVALFSYQAQVGYTFENGSSIDLGLGRRDTWNTPEGGEGTHVFKPIYSIKYELHK